MPKRYTIDSPSIVRVVAQGTRRNAHGDVVLHIPLRSGGFKCNTVHWTVAPGGWGTPHLTLDGAVPMVLHPQVMVAIDDLLAKLPVRGGGVVSR